MRARVWIAPSSPRLRSSSAPAGVSATRYSSDLISLATPIFMPRASLQVAVAGQKQQPDDRFRVLTGLDQPGDVGLRHPDDLQLLVLGGARLAGFEGRRQEQMDALVGEAGRGEERRELPPLTTVQAGLFGQLATRSLERRLISVDESGRQFEQVC